MHVMVQPDRGHRQGVLLVPEIPGRDLAPANRHNNHAPGLQKYFGHVRGYPDIHQGNQVQPKYVLVGLGPQYLTNTIRRG
jgi:hypothetical protein